MTTKLAEAKKQIKALQKADKTIILRNAELSEKNIVLNRQAEDLINAKEKAEKSEQSFRLLINSIPETSIMLFDNDLKYLISGGGEIEKSGFEKSLIEGKTLREAFPNEVADLFEPFYLKALKGETSAFEMNFANFTYFQQVLPIYNAENKIFAGTVISQNITERKQAEQKLKGLSNIIENSLNEIYLFDTETLKFNFANNGALQNLGYTIEEIKTLTPIDIKPEFDNQTYLAVINPLLAGETKLLSFETKHQRKNGTTYPVEVNLQVAEYEGKKVITAIILDITQRKLVEQALKESEERYKDMFHNNPSICLLINHKTQQIEDANQAACNYYGYSYKEITKLKINQINTLSEIETSEIIETVVNKNINYFLFKHIKANGELSDVEVYVGKIYRHKEIFLFSIIHDISLRTKAQKALLESEEKYKVSELQLKAAQTVAHLGNWKWNLQTREVNWSDEMYNIFGIDKNSYTGNLGDAISNVIHPDDLHLVLPSNASGFAEKKPIGYRIIMPDKSIRYILALAGEAILDDNGKPLFLTGIAQDITELKQIELKIQQQNNELQKINTDKDQFIAILSHDLKNSFNVILGFSELLIENIHDYDKETIEEHLNIVNDAAKNTYKLLEDILLWIRANSGKLHFEPKKIVFNQLCSEVISNLINNANEKKISIICVENENIFFTADKDMFKTILRNLISNAIKFTNESGEIKIYAEQNQTETIITVSDNGIGIDIENQTNLWNLTQIHTTLGTANEKGTGFGLKLCKEFVEKHNGKIWVESELGKSSDFKFTIPL